METKKKKYVKPKLTVAEWDFNEAVCQDNTMVLSVCIKSEFGSELQRHINVVDSPEWRPDWKNYGE